MTGSLFIPPGLILIAGGVVLPLLTSRLRSVALIVLPLLTLALVWTVPDGPALQVPFLGYELTPVEGDKLSRLFGTVFAIMAFAGGLFALNQARTAELAAAFVNAGGAIGVALAGDLITVFVFWELMAIGSTVVVWCGGPFAHRAGLRYATIHVLGGMLLMAGIAGRGCRNRRHRLYRHDGRHAAALPDPGRLSPQRSGTAAVGLAARCLSRGRRGRAWCSCRLSRPRRRSTRCCAASRAPSC